MVFVRVVWFATISSGHCTTGAAPVGGRDRHLKLNCLRPRGLVAAQESSPTPQFESISSLMLSLFYCPALTSIHGKTIALTIRTFEGKVVSLLFNTLSRFVIAFLPRNKCLLISWLQSPSTVIFGAQENKVCHCLHCFHIYLLWSDGTGCSDLCFLNVDFQARFFTLFFHFHQEAV